MNRYLTVLVFVFMAAFMAFMLSACATAPAEPKVRVVVQKVPIRDACVPPDVKPAPSAYPDDNLPSDPEAAPERMLGTAAANERRKARLAELEPIIAACR